MAAPPRIVRLDVKTAQAHPPPIHAPAPFPHDQLLDALDGPQHHDGAERAEPVAAEDGQRDGRLHGVGVTLVDLAVQLVGEVGEQGRGHLRRGGEGEQGGDRDAVAQGDLAGGDGLREEGDAGGGEGAGAGGAGEGWGERVVEHGWHLGSGCCVGAFVAGLPCRITRYGRPQDDDPCEALWNA